MTIYVPFGDKKELTRFERIMEYASSRANDYLVYRGTIDSVVEIDGMVMRARLKVGSDKNTTYRVQLCLLVGSYLIDGIPAGLFDLEGNRPLYRTGCELGDEVCAVGWFKDMGDQSWDHFRLNLPVRAYGNYSAMFFSSSDCLERHILSEQKKSGKDEANPVSVTNFIE